MKTNLFKSLLVAVMAIGAMGGVSSVQAATETYDFASFVAQGTPTLTLTSTSVEQSGTNAKTVYVVGSQTSGSITLDLNRIALCSDANTNNTMRWIWRADKKNAYKNGLGGSWNAKGTAVTSYNISILKLTKGDKVTITYAVGGKHTDEAKIRVCSDNIISTDGTETKALKAEGVVASNTTYTVLTDGNLDMYVLDNNMAIQKIVIESNNIEESIEKPELSIVGANGGDRIVSIKTNKTNADNATITYYTTNGEDPTTSSKVYNGNITITSSDAKDGKVVVKALTVKTDDSNIKSEISTLEVNGVGTYLTLNAPEVSISFKQNGDNYIPVYNFSSDQSSITGTPDVTYSYEINSSNGTATSYEATEKGTLKVIVSADGYTSAEKTIAINNILFNKSYNYDFSTLKSHSEKEEDKEGSTTNYNGAGCQAYKLESNAFENITLNGMSQLWAITKKYTVGLMARVGKGSITYTGSFPEGSFFVGDNYASTTNVLSYSQYGVVKELSVYTPFVTETVSVSEAGFATYATTNNVVVPEDENVKVMTVKVNAAGTAIELNEVKAGTVIPAGKGILVKAAKGNYNFVVTSEAGKELESNNLVAATTDVTSDGTKFFALTKIGEKVGFALVENGVVIPAGKAYLEVAKATAAKFFGLDGEATGINSVKTAKADGAYYTLEGVKTTKPVKGLYIHNGKKIVVK